MAKIINIEKYLSEKIVDEIKLDNPNPSKETMDRMVRICDKLRRIKAEHERRTKHE